MSTLNEALQELDEIEKLQAHRKRTQGIDFYIPNPYQFKAHQSKAKTILFCGGNRIGKSTMGAVELSWHLTRKYPDWFPKERRFKKPIKAVIVVAKNGLIETVIEPKIKMYLPHNTIAHEKRVSQNYLSRITCVDGSTVDFLSNEMERTAFESADWDFYWGDEPQKKSRYYAIRRGLVDRGGLTVLTFTPLIEPWMKEELVDKADGVRIDAVVADIRDNKFDIKGNPILSEENILEFEKTLSEDERATRIHGRFFHLRGLVYTEFCDVHLVSETKDVKYQYPDPVIAVLDPHDRQPHHVIWAYVTREDDLYIHSELALHCTVDELAKAIKKVEAQNGYKVRKRLIDPNFGRTPLITTGRNFIQELYHSGLGGWMESDDAKEEGRLKVKEYLHFDRSQPISHTNRPKLYFYKDRVPLTIRSIRNHQYEEWIGIAQDERDPKETPKDKETHGADDCRYLCMSNPTHAGFKVHEYELAQAPY